MSSNNVQFETNENKYSECIYIGYVQLNIMCKKGAKI